MWRFIFLDLEVQSLFLGMGWDEVIELFRIPDYILTLTSVGYFVAA